MNFTYDDTKIFPHFY